MRRRQRRRYRRWRRVYSVAEFFGAGRCVEAGAEEPAVDEVRRLRERVREALRQRPGDVVVLMRASYVLARLAEVEHRLSGSGQDTVEELAEHMFALQQGIGRQLGIE